MLTRMKTKKTKAAAKGLIPEPYETASPERPACQECGAFRRATTPFMPPDVPEGWTRKLLVVAERPGQDEDKRSGTNLTGKAGQLLRKELLPEAGFHPRDLATYNAVRCADPNNATPTMKEVRLCRPFLLDVLTRLRPRYVIGLGTIAARAFTNQGNVTATSLRGRPINVPTNEDTYGQD